MLMYDKNIFFAKINYDKLVYHNDIWPFFIKLSVIDSLVGLDLINILIIAECSIKQCNEKKLQNNPDYFATRDFYIHSKI